jgi:hypothetical protein
MVDTYRIDDKCDTSRGIKGESSELIEAAKGD